MNLKHQKEIDHLLKCLDQYDPDELWRKISRTLLNKADALETQIETYQKIHKSTSPILSRVWSPNEKEKWQSNIGQCIQKKGFKSQDEFHQWSYQQHAEFIEFMIKILGLPFSQTYHNILDPKSSAESPIWFPEAKFNIVESCFQADDEQKALIFGDYQQIKTWTYADLKSKASQVQQGLKQLGISSGDRIALIMPMTPEAIAIYLGSLATGCSVITIAESFSEAEIKIRLDLTHPKCIFTQDVIPRGEKTHPLYQRIKKCSHEKCIVLCVEQDTKLDQNDQNLSNFLKPPTALKYAEQNPHAELNILFSSGTTGNPKAIPWDHTTPIRAAIDGHLHQDIREKDVVCWPTSLGWMMGPWLVFSTLINKGCIALFNDLPTQSSFGEFIQNNRVNILGIVPSIVKSWKQSQCMEKFDWSAIRCFSSTGECSNPKEMFYLMSLANFKPIIEYCGGTEIGGGYISSTLFKPNAPGYFNSPVMGTNWKLFDEEHNETNMGEVFIQSPSIGLSTRLLNRNHLETYFDHTPQTNDGLTWRSHGDMIEKIDDNTYRAHGRADDTMNLRGIKVSTTQIETEVLKHDDINEVAAIAIPPKEGGPSRLILYLVVNENSPKKDLHQACQTIITKHINPLFKVHDIAIIDKLPRTASNKVMRRNLRDDYLKKTS